MNTQEELRAALGQPSQLLRTKSVLRHRDNLSLIVSRSLDSFKDELYMICGSTIADLGDHRDLALEMLMTNFTHDIQRRTDRLCHQNISEFHFRNGTLDLPEMHTLVRKILTQIKDSLPVLVQSAMQPAIDSMHGWIESEATGPMGMKHGMGGMKLIQDANIQGRVSNANGKMTALLGELMEALVLHSDELAAEVFDEVDADKDGKVTQQEFVEGFGEAMGQVLDFSRIVSELLRDRARRGGYSQPSLMRSTSTADDPGCGTLLFGVGMTVLMAGMGYQVFSKRMAPRV